MIGSSHFYDLLPCTAIFGAEEKFLYQTSPLVSDYLPQYGLSVGNSSSGFLFPRSILDTAVRSCSSFHLLTYRHLARSETEVASHYKKNASASYVRQDIAVQSAGISHGATCNDLTGTWGRSISTRIGHSRF